MDIEICTCDCKTMHYSDRDGWLCDACNGIVEKWIGYSDDPQDDYPYYDTDEYDYYDYTEGDVGQDGEI